MTWSDLIPWNWGKKEKLPVKRERSMSRMSRTDLEPFDRLRHEFDRVFDEFWHSFGARGPKDVELPSMGFVPSVDVVEDDKKILVTVELPGLDEKDLEVMVTHDELTIRGEKKNEVEKKEGNLHRIERSYGSFIRHIALPDDVVPDKVEASFKKGILTVELPREASSKAHRKSVAVKTA